MPDRFNNELLLGLIQTIHETALCPTEWTGVVADIVQATGSTGGCLLSFEGANESRLSLHVSGLNRTLLCQPAHLEALYRASMPLAPGSKIVLSFRRQGNLPWWHALRDCFGDEGEVVLVMLAKEGRRRIVLLLFFDQGNDRHFASCEEITTRILPHLQMAIAMQRERSRDQDRMTQLEEIFANSNTPAAVVTQDLHVLFSNPRFERLFSLRAQQFSLTEGRLELKDEALSRKLSLLMTRACGNIRDNPLSWVRDVSTGQSWLIAVHRLKNSQEPASRSNSLFRDRETHYLLTVCDLTDGLSTSPHDISVLFGLTPVEADLVFALANGNSPAEIARCRGVSKNTVHNQLASAMSRIGVRRQSQLTSLLSTVDCIMT